MDYDLGIDDVSELMDSTAPSDGGQSDVIQNAAPAAQEPQMFEYQASGKVIKEDLDTILKRASQGYNYAQHINEHKANVTSFQQERDQHLSQFGQWKEMHDYATQNPTWADHVKSQWEQRQSFGQSENTENQAPQASNGLNPEIASFMEEYRRDKQLRQESEEDAALNEQVQTVQKEFPDIDLSHTDPMTGISLEMKVLEHARAHGINSFKAAFKDMMFDELVSKKVTAAKEAAAKEITERQKTGFISSSDKSLNNLGKGFRKSSGSFHDDLMEGAREMGFLT